MPFGHVWCSQAMLNFQFESGDFWFSRPSRVETLENWSSRSLEPRLKSRGLHHWLRDTGICKCPFCRPLQWQIVHSHSVIFFKHFFPERNHITPWPAISLSMSSTSLRRVPAVFSTGICWTWKWVSVKATSPMHAESSVRNFFSQILILCHVTVVRTIICSGTPNFIEIGWFAAESDEIIFKLAAVRHLKFSKIAILVA